ncbi:Ig-like domain-containing protein [Cohnella faecalis]|nr:Ig-like domain-containing protein [Cohnella faecalis]
MGFAPAKARASTPETRYLTLKHDDFSATQDVDGTIPGKSPEKWLQRNGNAAVATDSQGRKVLRVTPNQANMTGSAFHGNMISFGKDRSFSTYFTFRMSDISTSTYSAGDGLVFSIQTLSKEAGVKGGGMGYGGMKRSFGIEFDTFANSATVAGDPLDPKAIGVNSGGTANASRGGNATTYDTSHVAVVADGNVDHSKSTTSPKGKVFPASVGGSTSNPSIIATPTAGETVPIYNFKTADTGTWASNNAFPFYNGEIYHAWIVYNGPTDTIEVYMGKNGTFDASKLKIKKSGLGLREYLEQDEAYVGFSAATGSAFENHDILKWYLNNNDLPIEPENPNYNYQVAPPLISITSTDYAVYGSTTSTTSRVITAQLKNYDGSNWSSGPYPVTFSLFKEESAKSYTITKTDGSTQVVSLKPRVDDTRVALKGESRRTNADGSSMRYATVMSDANGVATIQISNTLSTAITDSNVKAIVGDHYGNGVNGGGAYDEKPVTFAADTAPPTITSAAVDVSNPNHVKAFLSEYVLYPTDRTHPENWVAGNSSTWNANGFNVLIPDVSNPGAYVSVPATIVGGSGAPTEPLVLELASGTVVPFGYDVKLQYVKASGSLQDAAAQLVQDQTLFVDDYPFTPKGAAVVNNQARKTVEVSFNFPVRDNAVTPGSFKVYYNTGSGKTLATVTGAVSDGTDSKKLLLTLGTAIPAGATVTLDYVVPGSGGKVTNVTIDGLSAGHHTLKALTDFSVANQMAPTQAAVVADANRNKVKVVFGSEVELQGAAATLATAFKVGISSQGGLIDVSNVAIDSSDATGKTLILTLGGANLPSGGVPYGDTVTLNYNSTIVSAGVKEKNGSQRSLEWLTNFPVANQQILNVAIVSPANGSTTNNPNTVITGTSQVGSTVTVTVKDSGNHTVAGSTTVVPATGNWTFTPASPLADGTYSVTAVATDASDNKGTAASTFSVDTEAPDVDITGPANNSITNNPNTVITGTSDPGSIVTIVVKDSDNTTIAGIKTVDPVTGNWTFTPDDPLLDDTYTVTATAADGHGNTGTDTSTFTVDTIAPSIVIVSPADGSTTNNPNTVISGTSEPGSAVTIVVKNSSGTTIAGNKTVNPTTGAWTFTPNAALADDTYTVTAEATDAAGNTGTDTSTFTVDTQAPNVDITGPVNNSVTKDPNTVITGTSDPGTTVTIDVTDKDGDPVDGTLTVNPTTGNWTFTPDDPLTDGQYTVAVEANDGHGNTGTDTSTFTVDTIAPSIVIVSPADNSTTNNPNTVISGTSEPGSAVTIVVKNSSGTTIAGNKTVNPTTGAWTFTPNAALADDTYTVTAEATDAAGNTGTDTSTFTVDTQAPNVDITGPVNNSVTNNPNTVITGTSDPGTTVTIDVTDKDGDPVDGTLTVNPTTGNWTFTPDDPLTDGQYTVAVEANDGHGNTGTDTSTFTVDTIAPSIVIVSPADNSTTNNPNTIISGTSEPGSAVTIVVKNSSGTTIAGNKAVNATTGAWTFTPSAALADDTYTVTAEATDAAGNTGTDTSTFTVDTQAPNVDITGPVNNSVTKDPDTVITGTSDPGTTVTIVVTDKDGDPVDGTLTVNPTTGNWTFTPDDPLTDGEYTVAVEANDGHGNTGTDTSTFTVDTVAPSIVIVSPADNSTTNNPNTVISGTSEPGSAVTIVVKNSSGTTIAGNKAVNATTGAWTFTPNAALADDTYTVTAEATDAAGNTGTDTSTFTVDTQAPNVDITGPTNNSVTKDPDTVITGTSDPGTTVTIVVTDKDGDPVDGTLTVNPTTGNWTFTPDDPLTDGEYTVAVEANDGHGNTGSDTSTFTVDTVAPSIVIVSPADNSTTNNPNTVISGTSEPGSAVTIVVKNSSGTTIAGNKAVNATTGNWTFTPNAALADDTYTVTAEATDAAGNTGTDTSTFTVDTQAPNVDITGPVNNSVTKDPDTVITGTSDPDTTVTIVVTDKDGDPVDGTLTVNPTTGNWTFTPDDPLTDGEYTVAVEANDGHGNTGTDTSTFTVDTVAPSIVIVSPADNSTTNNPNTVISGTSEPGSAVTIVVKNSSGTTIAGNKTVNATTGAWTFTPTNPLADDTYTVTAEATDVAGNTGTDTSTFTVDTQAPNVDITGPVNNSVTKDPDTVITGTSDPDTTVTIVVTDKDGDPVDGTLTVNPTTGNWTFTPDDPLTDGEYTVAVEANDGHGNTGTDTSTFTVDTVAPSIVIVSPADNSTTNNPNTVISGTSEPGSAVTIVVKNSSGTTIAGNKTVNATTGAWTFTPTNPLADDTYTVTAEATDVAGNTGTDTSTFTVNTQAPNVDITGPADNSVTNNPGTVVTGTSDTGTTVTVVVKDSGDNPVDGTLVVDSVTGNWTFEPSDPLPDEEYTVTVEATDSHGNTGTDTSTFTVNTNRPNVDITGPADNSVTNNPGTVVTGTSDPGTTVTIVVKDSGGHPVAGTLDTDSSTGNWTFEPSDPLPDEEYTVTVEATDSHGNTGTDTSTFTVNTNKPNVDITGPADNSVTNNPGTVVTGTSDPGTTVTIVVKDSGGHPVAGTLDTDSSTGNWTFEPSDPLPDEEYTVTVEATDSHGNTGTDTITFTVDTNKPNVAVVSPSNGSTTNNPGTVITGTSEKGSDVSVTVNGGTVTGSLSVNTNTGNWTFTPDAPLADGSYTVVANAIDEAGNTGTATSAFTVDTQAPNVDITGPANNSVTKDPNTVITGTSDPGTTVTIVVKDNSGITVDGTPTVDLVSGNWTFTPNGTTGFADGTYTVTVEATDANGNTGTDTSTFTVDTQAPNVAIVSPANDSTTNNRSTVITGTSEPGSQVTVIVTVGNSTVAGHLAVTSATGNWTFTPNTPLADGTYTVTAEATDAAGNVADTESTFKVKVTYFITLIPSPAMLVADGHSISVLTAKVTDSAGNLVSGIDVDFSAVIQGTSTPKGRFVDAAGQVLGTPRATTVNGVATIRFQSESIHSVVSVNVDIKAAVHDTVHDIHAESTITVVFEPAVVSGIITDGANHQPLAGVTVTLLDANDQPIPGRTAVTDEDGRYTLPITEGNQTYKVQVSKTVGTGSSAVVVTYVQEVAVNDGISGLGQQFVSDQTIAGIIGGKRPDGSMQPIDFGSFVGNNNGGANPGFGMFLKDGAEYVSSSGGTVDVPGESDGFSINGQGVFVAGGLTAGKTYELQVRYYYDVRNGNGSVTREFIVIAKKTVTVSVSGEMNINEELIDPFGVITDSVTHAIIPNAHVVLKYADTARNRSKGITPGTTVLLPTLAGFEPANNANPQNSSSTGNYAFMVYGNTDYVIEATATGYQKYRSTVISVEQDIVRWDFEMNPVVTTPGGGGGGPIIFPPVDPEEPVTEKVVADITVNIAVERSTYEEGSEAPVVILYKNEADKPLAAGQLKVTLPDNVTVIDADGGKVTGNVIVWEVKDLAAGQIVSHRIRVKFPNIDAVEKVVTLKAEFVVDGELLHPENAKSSVKALVFSNRYGNERHTRFVMGYPDLMFKPEKSLTRAELATIIAHLLGEYDSGTTKNYSDVSNKFWAYKYIQTVTRHGIFSGYPDGSFHPNDPVSREELAVVMAKYLQLDVAKPIESRFGDAKGRWSSPYIEALNRNSLISGYPDGSFRPGNNIPRLEAVTMIDRMLFRGPLTNVSPSFPDVLKSNWGFGYVEEASRSHESTRNPDGSEVFVKSIEDNLQ